MKRYGYKWIDFLSNRCTIKVANINDFYVFKSFLKTMNLVDILGEDTEYSDWQKLARINGRNPNLFLFEYSNDKGLTWSDDIKEATGYYGVKPIKPNELFD